MPLSFSDYADRDGLGLAELVRRREVKPAELVETALAAIERLNPQLNAVTATMADEAAATLAADLPQGPFAGVPFLLKDLEPTYAGVPTTGGSRFFNGAVHSYDSEIMRRWKRAGLVAIGRTNTPERGSSGSTEPVATGPTHNPWRRGHTPGGSSGGSAAAVAAGIAPAGQAGDAGGSIRGPASCCGLVGLKPTRGRNSLGPDAGEGWHGLVVEHVVTRSVRDSAALVDCTAGYSVGDPHVAPLPLRPFRAEVGADPGRLRIGVALREAGGVRFHPDCADAVERTAKLLADLGHEIEEVSPSYDWAMLGEVVMVFFAASVGRAIEAHAEETGRTPSDGSPAQQC